MRALDLGCGLGGFALWFMLFGSYGFEVLLKALHHVGLNLGRVLQAVPP